MRHYKVNIIELGEAWRNHARMVPVGLTPIGTLSRDDRVHAFGRDSAGDYWIFGDGRPEPVPRIRVEKGLGALAMREGVKSDDVAPSENFS